MHSLKEIQLLCNKQFKLNFNGGELSSDGGLLMIKEFISALGLERIIKDTFKTTDTAIHRDHKDHENLLQMIYQIFGTYYEDNCADEIRKDPVLSAILGKQALASQPTISRFFNRMDDVTLRQFDALMRELRKTVYSIELPEYVLFDIDSTLLPTYGNQEGEGFNYHYQAHGYHPKMCFDGLTGDLLRAALYDGTDYCSKDSAEFMKPLISEYKKNYPSIQRFARADSGFATPELYDLFEDNDVTYGEFMYKAASWRHERRVIFKIEKPTNQFTFMYTFVVTNMELEPYQVISYYCNRGRMENFIGECKDGFDFASVSSKSKVVNANRLQLHTLVYNIFNLFRRLVLPEEMRKHLIDTVRLKLLKVATKIVHSGRYIKFNLCSSCPYKDEVFQVFENIWQLKVQLE